MTVKCPAAPRAPTAPADAPTVRPAPGERRPWLSVLMPTYNGAHLLPDALDSVAAQADADVEVIAVDDGSEDETIAVLESYRSRLCLKLVRLEHRGSWTANTNQALSLARGDWVSVLHQDDFWAPGRLAILRRLTASHPTAALFLHPSWYADIRGRRLGLWSCPLTPGRPLRPAAVVERLLIQNFISMPAPLVRRETALGLGGFDGALWYTADWDFWLKVAATGDTVYTRRPLSAFRLHTSSQTIRRSADLTEFRRQLALVLDRHLHTWSAPAGRRGSVERVARFSVELNVALAGSVQGTPAAWATLARDFLGLGPSGWRRYVCDSRITERVGARLRAGLGRQSTTPDVRQRAGTLDEAVSPAVGGRS